MAIVFIVSMLGMILPMLPASAGPPPCDALFEVRIKGVSLYDDCTPEAVQIRKHVTIPTAPPDGAGSTFTVEVYICGVEDMYAYEFKLSWTCSKFIMITDPVVEEVWPGQVVIKPDATDKQAIAKQIPGISVLTSYTQVVSATVPSTGVSGTFKLATLTFLLFNDVSLPEGTVYCDFTITGKVSDSCSGPIKL